MLLDPSSPAPVECDDEPSPPEPLKRRRPPKPRLTRTEAAQADARTIGILERCGIDFRPAQETALVVLSTGAVHHLSETRVRPIFAAQLRRRAADLALTFDAFHQDRDLRNLRLVGLRPRQGKAPPGTLAQALKTLARDYDRHVGRLVTAGIVAPILSVIHLRFDVVLGLWDIHVHALWDVADDKIDAMLIGLGTNFSDKWLDGNRVEHPGGAANYCASWAIDHRQIMAWPEEAILELWNLPRVRLLRPAGALRAFRGTLKGKVVSRVEDRVVVEERPDLGPRRKAAKRPAPAVEGGRVVAIGQMKVAGEKALCAVVKAPRGTLRPAMSTTANPAASRARVDLAYGEYRHNSPTADPNPPHVAPSPAAPAASPTAAPRKAAKGTLCAIPPRKRWMLAAWPRGSLRRLPKPIARRLAKSATETPVVASPFQDLDLAPPAPVPLSGCLGPDTFSGHPAGQPAPTGQPCAIVVASRVGSASTATSATAIIRRQTSPAGSMVWPVRSPLYASPATRPVPFSVPPAAMARPMLASTSSTLRAKVTVFPAASDDRGQFGRCASG